MVRRHSVLDVLKASTAEPFWWAKPLLTPGGITLLGGEPKLSGKTTLIFAALRAMALQEPFLGAPTQATPVLYLTEELPNTLRQVIRRSHLPEHTKVEFVYAHELGVRSWFDTMKLVERWLRDDGYGVLVIDTWTEFTGMLEASEKDQGMIRAAVAPLRQFASHDVAVLINHHFRKAESDSVITAMRGNTALPGAVDTVAGYKPKEGWRDDERELEVRSRFDAACGRWRVRLEAGRTRGVREA